MATGEIAVTVQFEAADGRGGQKAGYNQLDKRRGVHLD
jgi:hypothetical protein